MLNLQHGSLLPEINKNISTAIKKVARNSVLFQEGCDCPAAKAYGEDLNECSNRISGAIFLIVFHSNYGSILLIFRDYHGTDKDGRETDIANQRSGPIIFVFWWSKMEYVKRDLNHFQVPRIPQNSFCVHSNVVISGTCVISGRPVVPPDCACPIASVRTSFVDARHHSWNIWRICAW